MKRIALIVPLFLSLLHPALAGSILKEEVSADAKWLLHLDAAQFRASKVGSFIITEMLEKKLKQPVEQLKKNLKLDVDLDKIIGGINSITIYGTDYESLQDHSVLLVRTSPELQDILVGFLAGMALAGTNAPLPVTQSQEGGVTFYAVQNTAYCAVLPGKVIAIGRSREVTEKAGRVVAGKAPALASGAAFGGFGDLNESFFFLGVAEGFGAGNKLPPQAKLLQVADAGRVALGEDANQVFLSLALRGKTPEVVTQMQQVMQGIIAISALTVPEDKDIGQLLHSIKISTADNFVNVRVDYPVKRVIEQLAQTQKQVSEEEVAAVKGAIEQLSHARGEASASAAAPAEGGEKETRNLKPPTAPAGSPDTN